MSAGELPSSEPRPDQELPPDPCAATLPAATPPAPVSCPSCTALLDEAARFCGNCGSALRGDAAPVRRRDPYEAWRSFKPVLTLWASLLAINLVLGVVAKLSEFDAEERLIGDACATVASLLIVVAAALRERERLRPLLRADGLASKNLLVALVATLACGLFMTGYVWLGSRLHLPFLGYLDDYREAGWPIAIAFVSVAVLPPIYEELAFRGVMQQGLERAMRPVDALLVQAAMFSVLHLSPLNFVSHFGLGLAFGLVRQRTASLLPSMVVHAAWNAWVVVEELLGG